MPVALFQQVLTENGVQNGKLLFVIADKSLPFLSLCVIMSVIVNI